MRKKIKDMDNIPKDPNMLFSFVNMKLRDESLTLSEFCKSYQVDKIWLEETLRKAGFEYNEEGNKFW